MNLLNKLLTTLLSISILVMSVGCKENPQVDDELKSAINLKAMEVSADNRGGSYSIEYTISVPMNQTKIQAESDVDWVNNFNNDKYGTLTFNVDKNETGEVRVATITLTYGNADPTQFFVTQQSSPVLGSFKVEMLEQGYNHCVISVTPDSVNAKYLVGLFTMEEVEEFDLDNDEYLYDYHLDNIIESGSWMGLSPEASIDSSSREGIISNLKLKSLIAGEKYLFMACYYDTKTFERIGDLFRYEFNAKTPEVVERDFTFDIEINSSSVNITATPDSAVGRYYFDVMPRILVDSESAEMGVSVAEYFQKWWAKVSGNDISAGTPAINIYNNICSAGVDSYAVELLADTEYYVFAFEVNSEAACVSTPKFETFTTGKVEASELTLTFTVSDITSCGAKVTIDASNDTDPYVAGITTKEEWDTLGANDDERLTNLLNKYNFNQPAYGDGVFNEDKGFTPETTYIFYAFGYKGGIPTTKLFYVEFTTLSDSTAGIEVKIKRIGYFNAKDIKALDPTFIYDGLDANGYAVCPIELSTTGENDGLYYYNWHITPDFDLAWVTDDNRFGRMLYWKERPEYLWTIVAYDTEAWFGALAKDVEGYYSDQILEKENITRSGVSDAQLFIDWMAAHPDAEPDPSQYIDYYAGLEE